jgi:LuxR family maltose regulon positive regulatory protein
MLLRQLLARRVAPHAITRILGAFPARQGISGPGQQGGLLEPLSERELEILAMLRGRDSNKEIADRLYIAPSTVKRHTLNIYRKLEVNDRRAAVERADALGLFPADSFVA